MNELIRLWFNWTDLKSIIPILLEGARITIFVAVVAQVLGVFGGLFLALLRISKLRILRLPAIAYIDVFRGTPLIMQALIAYTALPLFGINLDAIPTGILVIGLNAAAYDAEILRAGIESIHRGQMEAARSLGMNYLQAMRHVILPQTVRRVLPPLTNDFIILLKDTAILSIMAVPEVLRVAKEWVGWKAKFTGYTGAAMIYLAMTLPLTRLVSWMERRLAMGEDGQAMKPGWLRSRMLRIRPEPIPGDRAQTDLVEP